jgi:hypothetical protein
LIFLLTLTRHVRYYPNNQETVFENSLDFSFNLNREVKGVILINPQQKSAKNLCSTRQSSKTFPNLLSSRSGEIAMKRSWISAFTGFFFLFLTGVTANQADGQSQTPTDRDLKALVEGNNEFAFDLYGWLARREGNLFYSPHSVSNALAVVLVGAKGDTAKEVAKVLGAQGNEQSFHSSFSSLNKRVQSIADQGKAEVSIANAFWRQDGIELGSAFIENCKKNYAVEFNKSDFLNNSEVARLSINEWAAAKTKGKIKELLSPGSVNDKTRFILVFLDISNATNSVGMFVKPASHLRIGPSPLKRVSVEASPFNMVNFASLTPWR